MIKKASASLQELSRRQVLRWYSSPAAAGTWACLLNTIAVTILSNVLSVNQYSWRSSSRYDLYIER